MKVKTLCRLGGLVPLTAAGFAAQAVYSKLPEDYGRIFTNDNIPLWGKLVFGIYYALPVAPLSLIAIDGLVDIVKGTHHYFGMQIWNKFTKNEEKKRKIESEIERQLELVEHRMPSISDIVNMLKK